MVELVERLRLLEQDHEPDGWPAVRMRDITALLDALEAAREDAERYRWLRDRHDRTHQDWHVRDQWNNAPAIGDLDAAIDAAREASNG